MLSPGANAEISLSAHSQLSQFRWNAGILPASSIAARADGATRVPVAAVFRAGRMPASIRAGFMPNGCETPALQSV